MSELPDFVKSYVDFIRFRDSAMKNGYIDLTGVNWLDSTTVMLLAFLRNKISYEIKSEDSNKALGYLSWVSGNPLWWTRNSSPLFDSLYSRSSYIPFSELPERSSDFKVLLSKIHSLIKSYETLGGQNAFKYVQNELADNIYQHSQFQSAFTMCQAYLGKGYIELSFVDDGISIPGNFELHNIEFKNDWTAIRLATEGLSTKDPVERGTGLRSSLRIYCEGADAEALIVSRQGAYHRKSVNSTLFTLKEDQAFSGTIVCIRIPISPPEIPIAGYLE